MVMVLLNLIWCQPYLILRLPNDGETHTENTENGDGADDRCSVLYTCGFFTFIIHVGGIMTAACTPNEHGSSI